MTERDRKLPCWGWHALRALALAAALVLLVSAECGDISSGPTISVATIRLTVRNDGTQVTEGGSNPYISGDGRFVIFNSDATDLVEGDINMVGDVFIKDRQTGEVELISLTPTGLQMTMDSFTEGVSFNGRYVLFRTTEMGGLIMMYVRDRVLDTTTRVVDPVLTPNSNLTEAAISDDGRYVAFASGATNFPGLTNAGTLQIYLSDLSTIPPTISLVSATAAMGTTGGNATHIRPDITRDGSVVVFASNSTNLQGASIDASYDIYHWTRTTGVLEVVSINPAGAEVDGSTGEPTVSDDGRYIAFETTAANMQPIRVAVRDRTMATTTSAYDEPFLGGFTLSSTPRISRDGRFVVWFRGSDTVVGPGNGNIHVFSRDVQTGNAVRASVNNFQKMGNGSSIWPDVSENGAWVVFSSSASNLVENDTNGLHDVFARGPLQW